MSGHHWCEPPHYPQSMSEQWECPECGLAYRAFDGTGETSWVGLPDTFTRNLASMPMRGLGWRTA